VSEDNPNNTATSPAADFLSDLRERILAGTSVYGDPNSARAVEKLAEVDAKLGLARRLGEAPPAPPPWTVERAAKERLAHEFPLGDPTTFRQSEMLTAGLAAKFEKLGQLTVREQAALAQQTAEDFAYHASDVSMNYSFARGGVVPTGLSIVEALLRDAEPAVNASIEPGKRAETMKLLRCDRRLLELYAVKGRNRTAYANRKAQLGIKS
jgi:hypothetical protein